MQQRAGKVRFAVLLFGPLDLFQPTHLETQGVGCGLVLLQFSSGAEEIKFGDVTTGLQARVRMVAESWPALQ